MTTIHVDKRRIRFERDDEALAQVKALQPEWVALELKLARLFARIDRKAAFIPAKAASVAEFAARRGYDGFRVRDLMHIGHALDGVPGLEDALKKGEVTFQAACEIGRLCRDPDLLEEDDDWLKVARVTRVGRELASEEAVPLRRGRPHEAAAPRRCCRVVAQQLEKPPRALP